MKAEVKRIKTPKEAVHGWLILDKPLGLTSTQALGRVRHLLGADKAGHGGTLDPLASGILPLAFGEATKLVPFVMDGRKEYEFTVRWGEERSTGDAEGEVIAHSDVRPSTAEIEAILPRFLGKQQQVPPLYSAIKIDGERAYDLARAGETPEMKAREIEIFTLTLLGQPSIDEASFCVNCGKGTYVRSLARDLAVALGTCGTVSALRRTKVGTFGLKDAISLEKLEDLAHKDAAKTALLGLQTALDDIPGLLLTANEAQRLRAGLSLLIRREHIELMHYPVIMAMHCDLPVAMIKAEAGMLKVLRGFRF